MFVLFGCSSAQFFGTPFEIRRHLPELAQRVGSLFLSQFDHHPFLPPRFQIIFRRKFKHRVK